MVRRGDVVRHIRRHRGRGGGCPDADAGQVRGALGQRRRRAGERPCAEAHSYSAQTPGSRRFAGLRFVPLSLAKREFLAAGRVAVRFSAWVGSFSDYFRPSSASLPIERAIGRVRGGGAVADERRQTERRGTGAADARRRPGRLHGSGRPLPGHGLCGSPRSRRHQRRSSRRIRGNTGLYEPEDRTRSSSLSGRTPRPR